jgi:hypothetical protein
MGSAQKEFFAYVIDHKCFARCLPRVVCGATGNHIHAPMARGWSAE